MKLARTILVAVALIAPAACNQGPSTSAPAEPTASTTAAAEQPVRERTVPEVAALLAANTAVVVDANSASTRTERGIIPGATLLTSSSRYDVARELPQDRSKSLVFYCGSTQCTASDSAARRASAAGYRDVSVLRAGIAGWREAGRPTAQPPST